MSESDRDSLKYFQETWKQINSGKPHNIPQAEVLRVTHYMEELHQMFREIEETSPWKEALEAMAAIRDFVQAQQELFRQTVHLNHIGWYISPDVIDEFDLAELHALTVKENVYLFEQKIIDEAPIFIPNILNRIGSEFPEREQIMDEILEAFEAGLYSSVVTLCYAQADGICHEVFKVSFYKPNGKGLKVAKKVENIEGFEGFLNQLNNANHEITASKGYLNPNVDISASYNRDHVMHGHSTQFGTLKNAIRAIYLVDFLSYLATEHQPERKEGSRYFR